MATPQGHVGRKRSEGAHTAVIAAALATLRESGYQQLTMEGVAARAGVAKATVYRWWPTKASLAVEVLSGQLGEPLQPTGNSEHDVRAVVAVIVEMVDGLVGEVLMADVGRDSQAGVELENLLGPYRAAHSAILLAAAGRGDLPYDLDARKVLELVSGVALFRKVMNSAADPLIVDQLTTLILRGKLPRASDAPR